jgi:hypothetical protein
MKNWFYLNKEYTNISDFPIETFGFIYKTIYVPSGISYIGKKSLYHNIKRKLTKKELAEQTGRGRKPTTQIIQKESDWKTYFGSAKPILNLLKENKHSEFEREILHICYNKKELTYYECKYLFQFGVLENPEKWFNDNILGKFFTKDLASQI